MRLGNREIEDTARSDDAAVLIAPGVSSVSCGTRIALGATCCSFQCRDAVSCARHAGCSSSDGRVRTDCARHRGHCFAAAIVTFWTTCAEGRRSTNVTFDGELGDVESETLVFCANESGFVEMNFEDMFALVVG